LKKMQKNGLEGEKHGPQPKTKNVAATKKKTRKCQQETEEGGCGKKWWLF